MPKDIRRMKNIKRDKGLETFWKERQKITCFDQILDTVKNFQLRRVAIACAQNEDVLMAASEALEKEVADYILVGDRDLILKMAEIHKLEIDESAIVHEPSALKAAARCVELVHENAADIVMKGYIHTDDFLRAILNRERGLRTGSIMSHVFIAEIRHMNKLLFIADGAMNIAPDLTTKADIILNTSHVAAMFGLDNPNVAILAAVELVNPSMPVTIEAATLAKMCQRRQFSTNCTIDGPFALDNAISAHSAELKKVGGPVAGKADILIVPDIEAGNILAKSLVYFAGADLAGVLVGAKVPVVLTSRSDNARSKLFSIATAVMMSNYQREVQLKIGKVYF